MASQDSLWFGCPDSKSNFMNYTIMQWNVSSSSLDTINSAPKDEPDQEYSISLSRGRIVDYNIIPNEDTNDNEIWILIDDDSASSQVDHNQNNSTLLEVSLGSHIEVYSTVAADSSSFLELRRNIVLKEVQHPSCFAVGFFYSPLAIEAQTEDSSSSLNLASTKSTSIPVVIAYVLFAVGLVSLFAAVLVVRKRKQMRLLKENAEQMVPLKEMKLVYGSTHEEILHV